MIRFKDASTLALTKLRTRKVRLIVTIVISGLLFSGLAAASIVARGTFSSIDEFSQEGFGQRYVARGEAQPDFSLFQSEAVMTRATQIHNETVIKKKAEAKRLGVTYDALTDPKPVEEYDSPIGKQRILSFTHPAALQALQEAAAATPAPGLADLQKLTANYDAKAFYESQLYSAGADGSAMAVLEGGKEDFSQTDGQMSFDGPPSGIDTFTMNWQLMSGDLLEPFILSGQNLDKSADGSVPIIIPFSAAEQLLNLKTLPNSAAPAERLARTKDVRDRASSLTFEICYRNSTSAGLVSEAVSTQQQIELNKNNKDYIRPELIYGLPKEACGPVVVSRDVRTAEVKALANKQAEFDRIFGKLDAEQSKVKFRVVGLAPDPYSFSATGVSQIISSLVASSLGEGWFTPIEYREENAVLAKLFNGQATGFTFGSFPTYYAEFESAEGTRQFIDKENCEPDYSVAEKDPVNGNPFAACLAAGKPFMLSAFGSNSLALESAKRDFIRIFSLVALGVAIIAAVIMMGTVGRMIADSRRETAVFRAIGAKKLDIAQIYIIYTILLSLLIFGFALVVGLGIAGWLHDRYSAEATIEALVAYNAQDLDKTFRLYDFYALDILYLAGLAVAAGMISAVIPLFRNLRRNPIRDMRDDT